MDKDLLLSVYEKIENNYDNKFSELKTEFEELDTLLIGVEKGSLITIGSRPAMGKSSFASSIMINLLKQEKDCLIFSFERSAEQLVLNLLANDGEINYLRLKSGYLSNKDWSNLADSMKNFMDYKLKIIDKNRSLNNIKEQIENEKPEFVFIDYVQLIEYKTKRPRSEAMSIIVNELKTIAKDNNCIIFLISQLSRAVETRTDKRPMLSDLRESGGIEENSDVVMFIYREEYYSKFIDNEDYGLNKGKAEIIVAKNKFGPVGIVNLIFNSSIPKFYNLTIGSGDVF